VFDVLGSIKNIKNLLGLFDTNLNHEDNFSLLEKFFNELKYLFVKKLEKNLIIFVFL
jgi:hypothetical protein